MIARIKSALTAYVFDISTMYFSFRRTSENPGISPMGTAPEAFGLSAISMHPCVPPKKNRLEPIAHRRASLREGLTQRLQPSPQLGRASASFYDQAIQPVHL